MWNLLLGAAAMSGCSSQSPQTRSAIEYLNAVQPVMLENSLLAERVLGMAAQIYDRDLPPDGFGPPWAQDVVPIATHLPLQAELLTVPEEWREPHDNLVAIWTDRASAYQGMSEALALADRPRWKSARDLVVQVVEREETWFINVNARLGTMELQLDQYP